MSPSPISKNERGKEMHGTESVVTGSFHELHTSVVPVPAGKRMCLTLMYADDTLRSMRHPILLKEVTDATKQLSKKG